MSLSYILFCGVVFAAVMMLLFGIYSSLKNARGSKAARIQRRLLGTPEVIKVEQSNISISKNRVMSNKPLLHRLLIQVPFSDKLDKLLTQSGSKINVATFCLICVASCLCITMPLVLLKTPLLVQAIAGAIAVGFPLFVMNKKKNNRSAPIEVQLPEALDMISRALRAGHALPSALKMAGDEIPNPLGGEFRTTFDEINFGIALPDALKNMAVRVPSVDLSFFVVAALIQRETGGNLTELLGKISAIVRERLKFFSGIRALTAEGRYSAILLVALPFLISGIMYVVNPDLMQLLWTDPMGLNMLTGTAILMTFGILWMRKLIRLRV